jgi:hypothetical protein
MKSVALLVMIVVVVALVVGAGFYAQQKRSRSRSRSRSPSSSRQPDTPFTTAPIMNLDDYEVSSIFQNRGSREASKQQLSDAMTRYPLDWSVQSPDSQVFQEGQVQWEKKKVENYENPPHTEAYQNIDGSNMVPMDTETQEEEEKKILQMYQPKSSKELLHYSVDDVQQLMDRVYNKRGLIPVIHKSKQGENMWEITEVKEKDPKIVWEDDVQTEREVQTQRGEQNIEVPITASDLSSGLDPFFAERSSTRHGKNDYTQWTPGLERMFAPTHPVKSWF